jgi:TonB family protein
MYYNYKMKLNLLQDKSELLKHGLSLLASLVIHGVLIFFLAIFFVSVKILDFREQVTPAFIVPAEKLHLPKIQGNLPNTQDWGAQFPDLIPRRGRPGREPAAVPEEEKTTGEVREPSAGAAIDDKMTSGFRLDRVLPEKPGSTSDKGPRFSLPQGAVISPIPGAAKTSPPKNVDLKQYLYGDLAGLGGLPSAIYYGGGSGRTTLRGRAPASLPVKNYDLSPWARSVIGLIQKNWIIPSTLPPGPTDTVEIAVIILKTGEISSAEILAPSDSKSFDRAALEAVEVSSPLPALPDDFPAARLEISFVFTRQL